MTPQEQAQTILNELSGGIADRLDELATRLATALGEGHTKHTVLEAYSEGINSTDWILRDMALKLVNAAGEGRGTPRTSQPLGSPSEVKHG